MALIETHSVATRDRATAKDRASILPLVCAITCFALWGLATASRLAGHAVAAAKSDAAAEAAALGAALGLDERQIAIANGANVLWTNRRPSGVSEVEPAESLEVGVIYQGMRAVASAVPPSGGAMTGGGAASRGGGRRNGLAPEMLGALEKADRLLSGRSMASPVPIVSGYRSVEEQMALWARRATNPYPVAPPGKSAHNRGMAVDVPRSWVGPLLSVAHEAGLCQPFPGRDPIHFAPVESSECGGGASGRAGRSGGGSQPVTVRLALPPELPGTQFTRRTS